MSRHHVIIPKAPALAVIGFLFIVLAYGSERLWLQILFGVLACACGLAVLRQERLREDSPRKIKK